MATPIVCFTDDALQSGGNFGDILYGGRGEDLLMGLGGADLLDGGKGRDIVIGGEGNDLLTGDDEGKRSSADLFVFGRSSGKDIITDFDIGRDGLQILEGLNGIKNAADVLDHAHQKGKNVIIDLGEGNRITLKNTDLDDLKKNPADHFDVTKNLGGW